MSVCSRVNSTQFFYHIFIFIILDFCIPFYNIVQKYQGQLVFPIVFYEFANITANLRSNRLTQNTG